MKSFIILAGAFAIANALPYGPLERPAPPASVRKNCFKGQGAAMHWDESICTVKDMCAEYDYKDEHRNVMANPVFKSTAECEKFHQPGSHGEHEEAVDVEDVDGDGDDDDDEQRRRSASGRNA